jgi:oligoendopeptidase F
MLPTLHKKTYQKLLSILLALREEIAAPNSRLTSIQEAFQQIQRVFQDEILSLGDDELQDAIASRAHSVQTEMHRALRLLETDIMFLRSSKQIATSEQRLATVRDRLEMLIGYCQAMLTFGQE